MSINLNVAKEAFFVGIATITIGVLIKYFIDMFAKSEKDKLYIFVIILFLTGFFIHILCQIAGLNKWYCKNGDACKNN